MTLFSRPRILTAAAALLLAGAVIPAAHAATKTAAAAPPIPWTTRCEKDGKYCEAFQQLSIQKKGEKQAQRLIEFAIGYPDAKNKSVAHGAFILPLGILLDKDAPVVMIDGKASFSFHVRYCDANGCVAVLEMPDANISAMRNGKMMTVNLETVNGQKVNIQMSLNGFGPALDKVKG